MKTENAKLTVVLAEIVDRQFNPDGTFPLELKFGDGLTTYCNITPEAAHRLWLDLAAMEGKLARARRVR